MSGPVLHADDPTHPEFTVCGMAFDAFDSGDSDEPIVFAERGQAITCTECRRVVLGIRKIRLGRLKKHNTRADRDREE